MRCDGDFLDGAALGGPMYYGHSPNGYSDKNVFNFQTKSVLEVFKALDDKQREKAVVDRQSRRKARLGQVPQADRGEARHRQPRT